MNKITVILFCIVVVIGELSGQNISINEINPTQSSLDITSANGASGGRVNQLGITSDGSVIYAASEWGGLYQSVDNGLNWTRLDNHLPVVTWDVQVSPSDNNDVFATSFYDGRVNSLAGLNVSLDGGASWNKPATFTPPIGFCENEDRRDELSGFGIAIDPNDNNNIYVGTSCGIGISNDGGATWDFVDPTPDNGADDVWDIIVQSEFIDIIGDDGHYRSDDGGTSWTTTSNPANQLPGGLGSIDVSPDEDYVLFVTVGTAIFQSVDAGESWQSITNPNAQGRIPFVKINDRSGRQFDLWFGDVGLNRCACTTPNSPASGGTGRCPVNTWSADFTLPAGGHNDCGDILFDPTTAVDACPIIYSSDGGVYYNTMNTSTACHSPQWEQPNTTIRSLWLFGMGGADQTSGEALYFGLQDDGTYASTNAQANSPTWNNRQCCDGFDIAANQTNVLYTVCCWAGNSRLFLRNSGMTGGGRILPPAGGLRRFMDTDIIDFVQNNAFVLVTTSGVYYTTNINATPSITWNQLGAATSPGGIVGIKTSIDGSGNISFFAQTGGGNGRTADGLWRYNGTATTNNWQQINAPGSVGGFGIFDVHPSNPNLIIASHLQNSSDPDMVLSDDGGTSWTTLGNLNNLMTGSGIFNYQNNIGPTNFTAFLGYPQPSLVAYNPYDEDFIIAGGADSGIFLSTDGGTNWSLITDPNNSNNTVPHIPRPKFAYFDPILDINYDYNYDVYIGTKGRGVWRLNIKKPGRVFTDICIRRPELCLIADLAIGQLIFDCEGRTPCIVRDPIERNCFVKYNCPGCEFTQLCPPYYHMIFEDFPIEVFDIGLYHPEDDNIDYKVKRIKNDIVMSFRPSKNHFKEKNIGDYEIVFISKDGVEKTPSSPIKIKTNLIASDGAFDMVKDYERLKKNPSKESL